MLAHKIAFKETHALIIVNQDVGNIPPRVTFCYESVWSVKGLTLTARFMGPTRGPSGADRTQVGPCWPHEFCYLGTFMNYFVVISNMVNYKNIASRYVYTQIFTYQPKHSFFIIYKTYFLSYMYISICIYISENVHSGINDINTKRVILSLNKVLNGCTYLTYCSVALIFELSEHYFFFRVWYDTFGVCNLSSTFFQWQNILVKE